MGMKRIILLRHGQSTWNLENRFTGWTDVPLTPQGEAEARQAGRLLKHQGWLLDYAFTSYLRRAIKTLDLALEELNQEWIPVEKSWRLNEKHYGALQGLNKSETSAKYGEEQVKIWRRSYDIPAPPLRPNDPRAPQKDIRYSHLAPELLPLTESLASATQRILPYWQENIFPLLRNKNNLLVAAHGNSLRAIIKHLKHISNKDIVKLNIPTAVPYVLEFDEKYQLIKDYFLADAQELRRRMEAVANQGKIQ